MALVRSFSRRLHSLLEPQSPLCLYRIFQPHQTLFFHHRPIASSPQTLDLRDPELERKENKKPLHVLFEGAVGLPEKTENSECEGKDDPENDKLLKKLRQLQREVSSQTGKFKQDGEALGLLEKAGNNESEGQCQSDPDNKKVKRKSRKLEGKLRRSKAKSKEEEEGVHRGEKPKKAEIKRLYDLFSNHSVHVNARKEVKLKEPVVSKEDKPRKANPRLNSEIAPVEKLKGKKQKEPVVLKELSPDMKIFVHHLYKEGYFNDANFAKGNKFDLSWFDVEYARYYILFAAQKFGKDKQEISKWLSGSDLKQVAMFGCPSVNRALVIPAKRLRNFFKIPENTVCSKCRLRDSCKFVNQSVWRSDTNNLDLAVTLKVICCYAQLSVHPQLVVPDELKNSVSRLLKEVLKLSETT